MLEQEHLPDTYERLAQQIDDRQWRRLQKCTLQERVQFWTSTECEIAETINTLRGKSSTYTKNSSTN